MLNSKLMQTALFSSKVDNFRPEVWILCGSKDSDSRLLEYLCKCSGFEVNGT